MQAIYNLNSDELNINFLNSIKSMFQNKNISIIVSDDDDLDTLQRTQELNARLQNYKNNPNIAIPISDLFWQENEDRLNQKYKN
jgi:hypothetical protein